MIIHLKIKVDNISNGKSSNFVEIEVIIYSNNKFPSGFECLYKQTNHLYQLIWEFFVPEQKHFAQKYGCLFVLYSLRCCSNNKNFTPSFPQETLT